MALSQNWLCWAEAAHLSELEQRADTPSGDEVLCLFRVISGSGPLLDFHIVARDIVCLSITGHVSWFLASAMED